MSNDGFQKAAEQILSEAVEVSASLRQLLPEVCRAAEMIGQGLQSGGRLLLFGNGGSAAQAQHAAAELVVRFDADRQPFAAFALTTDTSALTAIGNDYGFEEVFARQVRALGKPGDVVLAISTSGNSPNVLRALDAAREMRLTTIGLAGRTGGKMRERTGLCLCVPSDSTPRIQEAHLVICHILCQLIEVSLVHGRTHS
jgi:D-sedoheptulose 7-phosphate isomerase